MESETITLEQLYKKSDAVVFRYVAGEAILVPISNTVADLNSIFALNETAARVWELLDGERTLQSIREDLLAEYEVTEATVTSTLLALVDQLISIGAVVKV